MWRIRRAGLYLGRAGLVVTAAGIAAAGWGHFEAGWVRFRSRPVALPGLPSKLEGLRIVHLSDFHFGYPSRGAQAVERAIAWTVARKPDLTVITGDLLAHPRGEARLRELLARLPNCFAILGNHDLAITRDPFARGVEHADLGAARLLRNEAETIECRGCRVQVVGVEPRAYRRGESRPERLIERTAQLRILLCHFPEIVDRIRPGAFDLVLAGHLHAGQICLPYPGGRLRLAHVRWRYASGIYQRPAATLHVSPGLGTTFVPFRMLARPEATELVLAGDSASLQSAS